MCIRDRHIAYAAGGDVRKALNFVELSVDLVITDHHKQMCIKDSKKHTLHRENK